MKIAPIIDPSVRKPSPKPVRVDLRKVFMFGTARWAIALVVCIVLIAFGIDAERAQTVCEAGTVIGVLMLVWEHFDRWDYRRLGEYSAIYPRKILKKYDARLALSKARRASHYLHLRYLQHLPNVLHHSPPNGSTKANVLPCPGLLHTDAEPWWVNATCLTIASPKPMPSPECSF